MKKTFITPEDKGKIFRVCGSRYGEWFIKVRQVSGQSYYFDTAVDNNTWVETGNGQLYQNDGSLEYEELPRLTIAVLGMNQWLRFGNTYGIGK